MYFLLNPRKLVPTKIHPQYLVFFVQVNEATMLSPGVHTRKLTRRIDKKRAAKRAYQQTIEYKSAGKRIRLEVSMKVSPTKQILNSIRLQTLATTLHSTKILSDTLCIFTGYFENG